VKVFCFVKKGCKLKVFESESDLQLLNHEIILLAQWALDIYFVVMSCCHATIIVSQHPSDDDDDC
jgi:hypothetical protein